MSAVPAGRAGAFGVPSALAAAVLFFVLLAGLVVLDELPVTLLAAYGLVSAVALAWLVSEAPLSLP